MRIFFSLILLPTLLFSRQQKTIITHPSAVVPYEPWFTGPGLAPTAINMELGHPGFQPFFTTFYNYGFYNDNWKFKSRPTIWTYNYLIDFQFATTTRTGVEVIASLSNSHYGSRTSTHFTDTILILGYQVSNDKKDSWVPDFRLGLQTIFPTGNFRELKPENFLIDRTGQGAYFFGPNFAFQKLFYVENHFFVLHWSLGYFIPTRAHIRNFSAYGGGPGTHGTIRPGNLLTAYLSGEYSINQRWVFSFDNVFLYQQKAHDFHGTTILPVFNPTTVQYSFAAEVQYNLSTHSGFIFGAWTTLIGRNATTFAAAFVSFAHIF